MTAQHLIKNDSLFKPVRYVLIGVFVLLPLHAVFTTWLGSNFGHLDLFRIWKELIMVGIGLYTASIVWRNKVFADQFVKSWLTRLITIYTVFFVCFGALAYASHAVSSNALFYSLITNLRFVWFFLVMWVIAEHDDWWRKRWQLILLIPASLVVVFGLLQRTVLPADVLRHVGYGPNTIPAIQTVDQKLQFRRIQSTLRGANPLGAYLILIISALSVSWIRAKKNRTFMGVMMGLSLATLFFTFSRSAWIGLVVAAAVIVWSTIQNKTVRKVLIVGFVGFVIVASLSVWQLRHNDFLQNTLFHSDETSRAAESSNAARTSALLNGVKDVVDQPFGRGPGTAGPASFRNIKPARIAENYYLQIMQEVGLFGAALFVAINVLVFRELWSRRKHTLPLVLCASFAGITLVNMLSHAWADDTLSLLWWGLAGVSMSIPAILGTDKKRHNAATEK